MNGLLQALGHFEQPVLRSFFLLVNLFEVKKPLRHGVKPVLEGAGRPGKALAGRRARGNLRGGQNSWR